MLFTISTTNGKYEENSSPGLTLSPGEYSNLPIKKSNTFILDCWKKRLKVTPFYTVDKVIFNVAMLLIFGFLWYCAFYYNYDLDSYECLGSSFDTCKNPFYKAPSWKNQETLPAGKYGADLSKGPFKSAGLVSFILLISAFILNHFLYNKGKIKLTDLLKDLNDDD